MSALIVAFRLLLYLFHDVEKGRGPDGKHKLCTYGAEGSGRISVGWHTADTQRSPTCWIHICPCPYHEETETRSVHYTNSLIGDIAMVIYM